jgi:hypothetical protein
MEQLTPPPTHDPLTAVERIEYQRDARRWIESLCTAAIAGRRDDPQRIADARRQERGHAARFSRWERPEAPHAMVARELGLAPLARTVLLLIAAPQVWGEVAASYVSCVEGTRPLVDELLIGRLLDANIVLRTSIACELDHTAPLIARGAVLIGRGVRPYASLAARSQIAKRICGVR